MKIDATKVERAFALIKGIIRREDWRCRKCDRVLGVGSEFFLPFHYDPTAKRTEDVFLWCKNCHCSYVIPRRAQAEIRKVLKQPDERQQPTAGTRRECSKRRKP
jgi:hypothetical protein